MSELDFAGKRVLVTGGSGDIGRALCAAFAQRGADVAFTWFTNHEGRAATEALITGAGRQAHAIRANLRGKGGAQEIVDGVKAIWPAVDILISNAASGVLRPTTELTAKHWNWTLNINAQAFLEVVNGLSPTMVKGARIMALTSFGSIRAIENYAAVGASKAALEALVRHYAMELGPRGITVNALCPGVVDTGALTHFPNREQLIEVANYRTPNGRIATPQDVADVAVLMASPLAGMIQGQTVVIDGGYSILA